jgi:putative PIN family toxin of toxin-antitoxin system
MTAKLVLDTNVWLDWLVFSNEALKPLQSMVDAGLAKIVIDEACDAELVRVLGYPLQKWTLDAAAQSAAIARFRRIAHRVNPQAPGRLPACRDPDDQKFLALAAGACAHSLITKDKDLLRLARARYQLPFHIVTPDHFPAPPGVESRRPIPP